MTIFSTIFALMLPCVAVPQSIIFQDEVPVRDSIVYADSIVYREAPRVDKDLEGTDIMDNMSGTVSVRMSEKMDIAFRNQIEQNKSLKSDGYRIRIYLDNNRKSREESLAVEEEFKTFYPQYNTYRSFQNPFFKVTVGDFRTKSDARRFLRTLSYRYPTAFIVKEKIRFPIIDLSCSYVTDTLKVPVDTLYIPIADEQ